MNIVVLQEIVKVPEELSCSKAERTVLSIPETLTC